MKQVQHGVTGYQQSVTGYMQAIIGYPKPVTGYRLTRQSGLPQRLKDCDLFCDNELNDDGDFIHFALMAESELINTEEALSDPKWICAYERGAGIH
ncbi:hypothetical protein KIW84_076761 [Lathyrus oleraceus]|uniref:Uncharacterized protein n=1 Tax=Pisum sativum TaxID=3888 RepID=A0A9D5A3X3_PEA|nr:hypothetical protein KIW84_076761 [Pisum sativum]